MINKATNYEEAKVIIKNSVNSDLHKKNLKTMKLRATFIAALGTSAAVAAGLLTQTPTLSFLIMPSVAILDSPFLLGVFAHKRAMKRIENGSYFQDKSQEEIIRIANDYANEANSFEQKGGMKK